MDFITNIYTLLVEYNTLIYGVSAILCLIASVVGWVKMYNMDMINRNLKPYAPTLTIREIVGDIILSILPVWNTIVLVFHYSQVYLVILDIPLVRPKTREVDE